VAVSDYIFTNLYYFYISINHISIPEYLSYRTSSLVFNLLLAYFFLNTQISKVKIGGIVIIISSCSILLFVNGVSNIFFQD
jgi:drug/metabolite transporter (DMT)-like permease